MVFFGWGWMVVFATTFSSVRLLAKYQRHTRRVSTQQQNTTDSSALANEWDSRSLRKQTTTASMLGHVVKFEWFCQLSSTVSSRVSSCTTDGRVGAVTDLCMRRSRAWDSMQATAWWRPVASRMSPTLNIFRTCFATFCFGDSAWRAQREGGIRCSMLRWESRQHEA